MSSMPHLNTKLVKAIQANNIALATQLLDQGASANQGSSLLGGYHCTLCITAKFNHYEMTKLLIDRGAIITGISYEKEKISRTPIFEAIHSGSASIVELLVKSGSNPNGSGYILKKDIKHGSDVTPLTLAVSLNAANIVSTLLAVGADKELEDNNNRTPLMTAIAYNAGDALRTLLDAEVNYTCLNYLGRHETPMKYALRFDHAHVISVLENYEILKSISNEPHKVIPAIRRM